MGSTPEFVLNANTQHRELKLAEHYVSSHGGLLPDDPFWRYLEQRYDQAVISGHSMRFAHYHPVITPLLKENMEALQAIPPSRPIELPVLNVPPVTVAVPAMPVTIQGGPTMPFMPPATVVPPSMPQAVPEPAGIVLASLGLIGVILIGWLRR